jgi:hypothetical protein
MSNDIPSFRPAAEAGFLAKLLTQTFLILLAVGLMVGLIHVLQRGAASPTGDQANGASNSVEVSNEDAPLGDDLVDQKVDGSSAVAFDANQSCWYGPWSSDQRLLAVVILAGALGATIHGLRSFAWYVGNRYLATSWLPTYFVQPLVGGLLAVAFYLVLRGGLTVGDASADDLNSHGFAAIAVLVGMFAQQAIEKLKDVAEQVFARARTGNEAAVEPPSESPKNG